MMKAAVFVERGRIELADKAIPDVGPNDALIRITTTTICGTDIHILKGEYPVAKGLTIGHEPVGVIAEIGVGVTGYAVGDRVLVGAITPCGQCNACLSGHQSQCGHGHDCEALGVNLIVQWETVTDRVIDLKTVDAAVRAARSSANYVFVMGAKTASQVAAGLGADANSIVAMIAERPIVIGTKRK